MKKKKQSFKGFTLIEMITVIAIIAILMGVILPIIGTAKKRALAIKAKVMIESISAAIKMYEMDFGDIPPDDGVAAATSTESLYECLTIPWTTANGFSISAGPYIEFKGDVSKDIGVTNSDGDSLYEIVDPWSNEYSYEADDDNGAGGNAPYRNQYSFDIYSAGPDGNLSTAADNITNWE